MDSGLGDDEFQTYLIESAGLRPLLWDEGEWFVRNATQKQWPLESPQIMDRRPADNWLGTEQLQVIVGDPGAGKSTLLRYLVLDLLSDSPEWQAVAERWGQCLPVWLPFHFFTQRVDGQTGAPASIREALKAWLEQHDAGQIWPLVEKALNDQRLLLVIDGLDEWVNDQAGHYAVAAVETFAAARSAPVVVTTRPYGLERLRLGAGWTYKRIAPLTSEQQRLLATHYFQAVIEALERPASSEVVARSIDDFFSQVRNAPDLRAISGTPLFLVLLVGLHLSNMERLPTERFTVYNQAVQLLVADHPARRRVAASVTVPRHRLSDSQLRLILAHVAFLTQTRGDISEIQESVLREDFLAALRDPNNLALSAADAVNTADWLLDVAEGELGILVRKGSKELGFLHRLLQEQLAAEYICDRMEQADLRELFDNRLGDPKWREVLLAVIWKLSRPSELRELIRVIRDHIDESPQGLRIREILSEVTFGPYDLPAREIQENSAEIIETIETHVYGPHRARLLESFISGLEGAATGDIVRECLNRWVLLLQEPTEALVREISELPSSEKQSNEICKFLIRSLLNPNSWIAYSSASSIARRLAPGGPGNDKERQQFRRELLRILSDPPTGLAQAAALVTLALGWKDDHVVVDILNEAREHGDESVRVVALGNLLGLLQSVFPFSSESYEKDKNDFGKLKDSEREWLIRLFRVGPVRDIYWPLLAATVSEAVRDYNSVLYELLEILKLPEESRSEYINTDLVWSALLNVFSDDKQVLDFACEQLRSDQRPDVLGWRGLHDEKLLQTAYPVTSPQNIKLSEAVRDRLDKFKSSISSRELYQLATFYRGPEVKEALLEGLTSSSQPFWVAKALVDYFSDDEKVQNALVSVLKGDPGRASMISNIAPAVLEPEDVIPRLMEILREVRNYSDLKLGRYDLVAQTLADHFEEQEIDVDEEIELIATEALELLPDVPHPLIGDMRPVLAAALYPSAASKAFFSSLSNTVNCAPEMYLHLWRRAPEFIQPFLERSAAIFGSLPSYLRAQACKSLADRAVAPNVVMSLTERWADEVSHRNKSIASLAYHRALLRARQDGLIDENQWNQAVVHLREQATDSQGFDKQARVSSAWVGMCVSGEWSFLDEPRETDQDQSFPSLLLSDLIYGPDRALLQQIATHWRDLREELGDTFLTCLQGVLGLESTAEVWDRLALVAAQDGELQRELENAVADNSDLLKSTRVLAWLMTRNQSRVDEATNALVGHLEKSGGIQDSLVSILASQSERLDLLQGGLLIRLENTLEAVPEILREPTLEALAVLFPENKLVRDAWSMLSGLIEDQGSPHTVRVQPDIRFAVAYACVDTSELLTYIRRDLEWLDRTGLEFLGNPFAQNVSLRLRRDSNAAAVIRSAIMDPTTPDSEAAVLTSLLSSGAGLDDILLSEVGRRLDGQKEVLLAQIVRDHVVSASLSVRTILTRVADAAWDVRLI